MSSMLGAETSGPGRSNGSGRFELPGGVLKAPQDADELREQIRAHNIEFLIAQWVNIEGRANAAMAPVSELDGLLKNGAAFAGFASGHLGQYPHDPDMFAIPDVRSFTPLPWRPGYAVLSCDLVVEGEPWPYDPRTILRRQLARAQALGLDFRIGVEWEYMIVRRQPDGSIEVADPLDLHDKPCYDLHALTRELDFQSDIVRYLQALGWGVTAADKEDGNAQFENNWDFDEALRQADRSIFFRFMVGALAQQRGLVATFMPKPFADLTGNGGHHHMSLWNGDENIFASDDDPRGVGLSQQAYHFLGGLEDHAKAYVAVTAPTVNSYRRLSIGTRSGSTWAPIHIAYGYNNRTQMHRVFPGRIEDRSVDASCNPYLGAAVMLAAGLDGMERKLDPGEPTSKLNLHDLSEAELRDLGIEMLPDNLFDATKELEADGVLRSAFGEGRDGEDVVDYYIRLKRQEWREAQYPVSQWELDKYLMLF